MALFDIDCNQLAEQLSPPGKRMPKLRAFIQALLGGIKYNNTQFAQFRNGCAYYNASISYSKGDTVLFDGNKWLSVTEENNNSPGTNLNWALQEESPIGSDERIKYNGQKLILEYALNKRYGLVFRQPNDVSDIYITNNAIQNQGFSIGQSEANSGAYFLDHSIGGIINETYISSDIQFTIHIPLAFYTGYLNSSYTPLYNFLNQIIPAGLTYTCITY